MNDTMDPTTELARLERDADIKRVRDHAADSVRPAGRSTAAEITFTADEVRALWHVMLETGDTEAAEKKYRANLARHGVTSDTLHAIFCKVQAAEQIVTR